LAGVIEPWIVKMYCSAIYQNVIHLSASKSTEILSHRLRAVTCIILYAIFYLTNSISSGLS